MKKQLMFLALAAIGLASCNGGYNKLGAGMTYKIIDDKSGPSIKEGDYVFFNFNIKNDADSVLQSSFGKGMPQYAPMPKVVSGKGNIMEAFSFLSEGDSVVIKQEIDSAFKGRQKPPFLKGKYLVYEVKVEKVIAKGNLNDQVFQGRISDYAKKMEDALKAKEPADIKKYIADNKLKVTTTSSGLNYVITKAGSGPVAMVGDTAVVHYTVKNLAGKVFETSVKDVAVKNKMPIDPRNPYKPLRFPLGTQGMIAAWNEAFPLFNKGTQATLVVPSSLAYGEQGSREIGPFTPLVFDVELVDIIKPNPPKPAAPPALTPNAAPAPKK
ncbi:FKBP-type peptidyl-prolyl cis-trans isomerase [Mucilaginibacter sp. L3T2-6]|uniref:FKBP-type peptidyl-prolyl cis-trans isomerase n=1 Tax=Mucilaginibacter sp. L3T2-6 TaxID=3062491 RepID=UPI0026745603|nr:FKBP-type peptidyl-prolyl cis-trans isomerase [Mucilaginibacter sp. L3T2-6]MDO3642351.1 FKBP-type peptidyl-prolyl cis-trans isomerase [Mucilaginibacter sp. L3T2-6]MDV6214846.1 FKBP-type peptidyl-prolyl cis-trans isomerase [Mucilaginibacter sp. L3T2-6]